MAFNRGLSRMVCAMGRFGRTAVQRRSENPTSTSRAPTLVQTLRPAKSAVRLVAGRRRSAVPGRRRAARRRAGFSAAGDGGEVRAICGAGVGDVVG